MAGNPRDIALEPAAQAFADATSQPPFLYQLTPQDGRNTVDQVQNEEIYKPEIDEEWVEVTGGPTGTVKVRIVRPAGSAGQRLPVILYIHGAGWVFGNAHTHDRLVRDLAVGAGAAVVFPEYDRSPDVGYPVAIEQSYAVAQWVTAEGASNDLDGTRMAVSGDSVGGNMAIALTLLAKSRGDVRFIKQVEFYPVTDAAFDTASYHEFAEGYFLGREGMKWFWDQYTTSQSERAEITASPLRASVEDLAGLPPALIITAEADVLRDEGEAFAAKLRRAGVPATNARFGGIVHDFVMVNALHDTEAAKHAVLLAVASLKQAFAAAATNG
jgi:acetyl esterase/lipase